MALVNSYRWRAYDVLRLVMALVLLAAAGLKAHQLATESILGSGLMESRWFLIGVVEFELLFALWLLSSLLPSPFGRGAGGEGSFQQGGAGGEGFLTWLTSLVLFSALACVSLYKALSGHATCGCFGTIEVNPWYALTLDAAIVVSLLVFRPPTICVPGVFPVQFSTRAGLVCLIWLVFGGYAGFRASVAETAALSDAGEIIGEGDVVVLEPEKWVGKRFPLIEYMDIRADVREGEWAVLLYHHNCPKCLETIEELPRIAQRLGGARAAAIEVPPISGGVLTTKPGVVLGRLSDSVAWRVMTPVLVSLQNGIVVGSSDATTLGRSLENDG